MKSISEIANELGISVQAVHKRIKKILADTEKKRILSGCIQKDLKGKMYLNEQGESIIKSIYQLDASTISTKSLNLVDGLNKPFQEDENTSYSESDDTKILAEQPNEKLYQQSLNKGSNGKAQSVEGLSKPVDDSIGNDDEMVEVTVNENDRKRDYNDIADKVDRLIKKVEAVEAEPQVRNESFDDLLKLVKEQAVQIEKLNEELGKERNHSREQANRILTLAEQMAELTRNNQVLLKQEQDRTVKMLLMDEKIIEKKQKKSFFGWMSKKQYSNEDN